MTADDKFKVLQTLEILESKLQNDSNSCEFEFLLKLKEELENKLKG
jgi:hypothetical protein